MTQSDSYRADIDGLRAIAVVSVLLFHLGVGFLSGGYVGVDVFFVISGYLITGLIAGELASERFSLKAFYLRRVRRIAPPLIVMVLPTSIAAWMLLYPEAMRSFASSLALQFLSLQNFFYLAEGEYFIGSDTKLLLHTWTLAVEEQFYLLWPLLLILTRRMGARRQLGVVLALLLVSFVVNLALMRISPKASFFLLPPRAWELGIGGVLALRERHGFDPRQLPMWLRDLAGLGGLAAIAVSVVHFTPQTPFPGTAALLPVVGSALVIGSGGGRTAVARLLSQRPLVHIGLISYSLYLWHWPLIVVTRLLRHDPGAPAYAVAIIVAAVALAEASYRFVETPIRRRRWLPSSRSLLLATGSAAFALSAFGVHLMATRGAAYRYPPLARSLLTASQASRSDRCGIVFRVLHPTASVCTLYAAPSPARRVMLWGNSHADMWSGLFQELGAADHADVYLNARNCRATRDSDFCGAAVQRSVLSFIDAHRVTDVVLASHWYGAYDIKDSVFESELTQLVSALSSRNLRVWLVVDPPASPAFDPVTEYERNPASPAFGRVPISAYAPERDRERALFTALQSDRVHVVDPSLLLCQPTECSGGNGTDAWYRDPGHVTDAGARAARAAFGIVFGDSASGPGATAGPQRPQRAASTS